MGATIAVWVGERQRGTGSPLWSARGGRRADGTVAGLSPSRCEAARIRREATQSLSTLIRTQRHTLPALVSVPTGLRCRGRVWIPFFCLSLRSNRTFCAASHRVPVKQYERCVCVYIDPSHGCRSYTNNNKNAACPLLVVLDKM